MITRVRARYLRISPRKTRQVIDLIRGKSIMQAEAILSYVNKRPALYIKRLMSSAVDSADKKFHLSPAELIVSVIKADVGPLLKRHRAASMGRATEILHRTTHLTIELDKIVQKTVKENVKKAQQLQIVKAVKEKQENVQEKTKIKTTKKSRTKKEGVVR